MPARMPHVGDQQPGADQHARSDRHRRHRRAPDRRQPGHGQRQAAGRQHETAPVQRRHRLPQLRHMPPRQPHAQHPDRQVDQENETPVRVGGDRPAQHRPQHRPEHGRDGQPAQRPHQPGLVDRAQQHQPPDRHHHRPAHALHEAPGHQLPQPVTGRAPQRTEQEHRDRRHEGAPRPEPVRHPAADRNEHRQRHQVGGQRQLQRHRLGAQVGGDLRQRGGDRRGVHVLDEQGGGDDQREQALGAHGLSAVPAGSVVIVFALVADGQHRHRLAVLDFK